MSTTTLGRDQFFDVTNQAPDIQALVVNEPVAAALDVSNIRCRPDECGEPPVPMNAASSRAERSEYLLSIWTGLSDNLHGSTFVYNCLPGMKKDTALPYAKAAITCAQEKWTLPDSTHPDGKVTLEAESENKANTAGWCILDSCPDIQSVFEDTSAGLLSQGTRKPGIYTVKVVYTAPTDFTGYTVSNPTTGEVGASYSLCDDVTDQNCYVHGGTSFSYNAYAGGEATVTQGDCGLEVSGARAYDRADPDRSSLQRWVYPGGGANSPGGTGVPDGNYQNYAVTFVANEPSDSSTGGGTAWPQGQKGGNYPCYDAKHRILNTKRLMMSEAMFECAYGYRYIGTVASEKYGYNNGGIESIILRCEPKFDTLAQADRTTAVEWVSVGSNAVNTQGNLGAVIKCTRIVCERFRLLSAADGTEEFYKQFRGTMTTSDILMLDVNDHQNGVKYANTTVFWPACVVAGQLKAAAVSTSMSRMTFEGGKSAGAPAGKNEIQELLDHVVPNQGGRSWSRDTLEITAHPSDLAKPHLTKVDSV
jgi:hypothetical protein